MKCLLCGCFSIAKIISLSFYIHLKGKEAPYLIDIPPTCLRIRRVCTSPRVSRWTHLIAIAASDGNDAEADNRGNCVPLRVSSPVVLSFGVITLSTLQSQSIKWMRRWGYGITFLKGDLGIMQSCGEFNLKQVALWSIGEDVLLFVKTLKL